MCASIVLHCLMLAFGMHHFHHATSGQAAASTLLVKLIKPLPKQEENDLAEDAAVVAPETLFTLASETDSNAERYYLPPELSRPVVALNDPTATLNIPIFQTVVMALYINEAGTVDEVRFEEPGSLSEEEQQELKRVFAELMFLPGMRGAKVVKAIDRIQLEVNRRIIIHH